MASRGPYMGQGPQNWSPINPGSWGDQLGSISGVLDPFWAPGGLRRLRAPHCYAIFLFSLDIVAKSSSYQFPYNMCAQGTRLISVNQIHIRPMSNLCRLLSSKNSEMWNRFKIANFRPDDLDVGGPHKFLVRGH